MCPHSIRLVTHGYEDIYGITMQDAKIFQSVISPKGDKTPASAAMASCTSCARHRAASTRARIAGRRGPAMALPFRWRPNKARQPGGRNGSNFQGKPLARCESPPSWLADKTHQLKSMSYP